MKADNEFAREEKHEITSVLESKNYETDKDLANGKCDRDGLENALRPHSYMEVEDSIGGTANESHNMITSNSIPTTDRELLKNETIFYTDKAFVQTEPPQLMVCLKTSSCNDVKDICIDEGVPSMDKFFVEESKVDHDRVIGLPYSDLVGSSDFSKEDVCSLPSSDGLIWFDFDDKEVGDLCSPENSLKQDRHDDDAMEEIVNVISEENVIPPNLLLVDSAELVPESLISFGFDGQLIFGDEDKKVASQGSSKMSIEEEFIAYVTDRNVNDIYDGNDMLKNSLLVQELEIEDRHYDSSDFSGIDQQQSDQRHLSTPMDGVDVRRTNSCEETELATSMSPSSTDVSLSNNTTNHLPFDRRVENGSITFDFNSPLSGNGVSARAEGIENAYNQQSSRSPGVLELEDGGLDSLTSSTRGFFIQHGHGESDFLGAFSGPIAYSGSIQFSGSVSIRSESSTTSTRSFAFPVLHSEWNSSPVKMAKAERRQKRRGWRIPVFCCKF